MSSPLWPHGLQHARLPCASPSKEFAQTHAHWVGDAIQPSHLSWSVTHFSSCSQSFPASGSFPKSLGIRWPKHCNFSLSISPSNVYSALISFRIDWFDPLAVQEILKNVLQHHSSKASIFLALNLHYGPTLESVHDYWENHTSSNPILSNFYGVFLTLAWLTWASGIELNF